MRLLLIARVNARSTRLSGVFAKLKGQVAALSSAGADVGFLHMDGNRQVLARWDDAVKALMYEREWGPVAKQGEQEIFWQGAAEAARLWAPDTVLLRYERMYEAPVLVTFLESLPRQTVRLLEFPTLPYAGEIADPALVAADRANRDRLPPHVSQALSPSPVAAVSGMPVARFDNRIDLSAPEITLGQGPLSGPDGVLHLLVVSFLESYKGIDRALAGLADAPDVPARLTVVGEGSERPALMRQAERLNITDRVTFTGPLSGAALHPLLARASAGVGSIGMHRKGVTAGSPLKGRLYMACGLPVIVSYDDPLLERAGPIIRVPADDSPLPVAQIAREVNALTLSGATRQSIAGTARPEIGWEGFARWLLNLTRRAAQAS
ncbi:glycosyltransferase [Yunchengibacter salinarum]|uniref:glycosyltransferase n=1 Tax=Yunchengibacter salinarum TaxID=3133399 RepID=UPI0035B58F3C